MNDLFSTITGLLIHAYTTAAELTLILLPAKMLFNGLRGRFDLR